ncbi:hypothetical protein N7468_008408 [Penicillium chermesinum]|uniref:Uncharacterized protein n=1 Tax=Penicillium chermesinum TaxID=63820 RepID=A0A9W9TIB7_9EURO|nr:uncharacterized protein N7468_008408 [Penicillium chermesinum]KAJ5223866.1 hypothetical protein N7468_008408 [Penicillium chermesinum]
MGRTEPPFIYDRPSTYNFDGPIDRGFNPKAVTQASWAPASPTKPRPEGPMITFNRHPDTVRAHDRDIFYQVLMDTNNTVVGKPRPEETALQAHEPKDKDLGERFAWISVGSPNHHPAWGAGVAVLRNCHQECCDIDHLDYAGWRSYGVFSAILDAGLIPFYVFTAFVSYDNLTTNDYHWGTLFQDDQATIDIANATFICACANAGLHAVSFGLSIAIAIIFRKISSMPPDMNPLEDNLTARPRKNRKRMEPNEKHWSSSTLNDNAQDPLMDAPRTIPFTHTREQSLGGQTIHGSPELMSEKRMSQISAKAPQLPEIEPSSPADTLFNSDGPPFGRLGDTLAPEYRKVASHSPVFGDASLHTRHLESRTADRSESVSPVSDNWVAHSERAVSPLADEQNQLAQNNGTLRQSSSVYSRRTDKSTTSVGSGIRDWFAYGTKPAPSIGSAIPEDARGEYASLAMHEYYGQEDGKDEQDLGDRRFNIFPDPEEHDTDKEDDRGNIPFNPLMLNPPTPQPVLTEMAENTDPVRRYAPSDNPNSQNQQPQVVIPAEGFVGSPPSPSKGRFYGDLEEEGKVVLGQLRDPSGQQMPKRKLTKISKKRSKMSAYESLKKDDSDDEDGVGGRAANAPVSKEGDRKGRVVSNSGADTARLESSVVLALRCHRTVAILPDWALVDVAMLVGR